MRIHARPSLAFALLAALCAPSCSTLEDTLEEGFREKARERLDVVVRQEGPTTEYLISMLSKRMEYRDRTMRSGDGKTVTRFYPVKQGKGALLRTLLQDNLAVHKEVQAKGITISSYENYDWFYEYRPVSEGTPGSQATQAHGLDLLQVSGDEKAADWVDAVIAEAEYRPQVLLDVAVLTVSWSDQYDIGTGFDVRKPADLTIDAASGMVDPTHGTVNRFLSENRISGDPELAGSSSLNVAPLHGDTSVNAVIEALARKEKVDVLSRPTLLVMSGFGAEIFTGRRIPVPQVTGGQNGTTAVVVQVDFEPVGVNLQILPVVRKDTVQLEIQPEVSDVVGFTNLGGVDEPVIDKSFVRTSVEVRSGETLILGGLYTRTAYHGKKGIPGLVDVPGLNYLQGSTSDKAEFSNLVFVIKPRIIYGTEDREPEAAGK